MKNTKRLVAYRLALLALLLTPVVTWTADEEVSSTGSLLRMTLGLALVLGAIAGIAWLMKRMTPGLKQQSVVRIVGGVSVGNRERVVVVEVAGHWLVLGVAPGQVSSLADIEPGEEITLAGPATNQAGRPFSACLNKSLQRKL